MKSWLIICADENNDIHLWDCNKDLPNDLNKIASKGWRVIDFISFTVCNGAKDYSLTIKQVQRELNEWRQKATNGQSPPAQPLD